MQFWAQAHKYQLKANKKNELHLIQLIAEADP